MELGLRFDLEKLVKSLRCYLLSQKSYSGYTSTFLTKTCQEFAHYLFDSNIDLNR